MATVEFRVAERAHITVDSEACRSCTTKACPHACPAALFVPTTDGGILFNYEQCFECGTWSPGVQHRRRHQLHLPGPGGCVVPRPEGMRKHARDRGRPQLVLALEPNSNWLTGAVTADRRDRGPNGSELAALEHALRLAEKWDAQVVAATVALAEADEMLRHALAARAAHALRVEP